MIRPLVPLAVIVLSCGGRLEGTSVGAQSAAPPESGAEASGGGGSGGGTCGAAPATPAVRELDNRFRGFEGVASDGVYVYYAGTFVAEILRQPIAGGPRETFATDRSAVRAMRGHAARVCWAGMRVECVESGGAPRLIAAAIGRELSVHWEFEHDIDFDDAYVYWAAENKIERAPMDGSGPVEVVAAGQANPRTVTVGGGRVVWLNYGSGQVMACATTGCGLSPKELTRIPNIRGGSYETDAVLPGKIAADERYVYVPLHRSAPSGREGSLVRIPLEGGDPVAVWSCAGESGINVTLDGDRAYLLTHVAGAYPGGFAGPDAGNVLELTLSTGAVRTVAHGQLYPQDVALADGLVFWTNERTPDRVREGQLMVAPR